MRDRFFFAKSRAQLFFLSTGLLFLLYLVSTVTYRSHKRKSVLGTEVQTSANAEIFADSGTLDSSGMQFVLRDFQRTEVRNAKAAWEIKAKDAQYFAGDAVTYVDDATLRIHRSGGSYVDVRTRGARLHMTEHSISRADLEGNVAVKIDQSLVIETDMAVYHATEGEITAPGRVRIHGTGFEVQGVGMRLEIEEQIVRLIDEVSSNFQSEASVPPSLSASSKMF